MKFKRMTILLILLSLSIIFSSCNSVKPANESSEIAMEISSVASIEKIESELPKVSSKIPQTTQQSHSNTTQNSEDLSSEGKQRANKLMTELKNIDVDIIRFYSTDKTALGSVGFSSFSDRAEKLQPHNVIEGAKQIEKFMTALKLDKWTPKKFNLRSLPEAVIYITENLHINLEAQHQGISWMSINSAENANVYFVVPNDVYNSLTGYIKYEKTPANAIGYYTELTDNELKTAEDYLNTLKNAEINTLNIYDDSIVFGAGFKTFEKIKSIKVPTKIINNQQEIKKIINELQIEKWAPKRYVAKSYAKAVIYVSEDMHINLEGQQNGIPWMSINSKDNINIYYVVPNEVYQKVLEYIK